MSCAASYCVPHWPVWRFTIRNVPVCVCCSQSVYIPGASVRLPSASVRVVKRCVASFAPKRQTESIGTSVPPQTVRSRTCGRP